ncbi:hypothetical protein BD779DRAFT_1674454 [Infundibulicybe gibba]|nr:hypothetical protein BD779DRAFT_1674454 [Infundibulicybe gibba]
MPICSSCCVSFSFIGFTRHLANTTRPGCKKLLEERIGAAIATDTDDPSVVEPLGSTGSENSDDEMEADSADAADVGDTSDDEVLEGSGFPSLENSDGEMDVDPQLGGLPERNTFHDPSQEADDNIHTAWCHGEGTGIMPDGSGGGGGVASEEDVVDDNGALSEDEDDEGGIIWGDDYDAVNLDRDEVLEPPPELDQPSLGQQPFELPVGMDADTASDVGEPFIETLVSRAGEPLEQGAGDSGYDGYKKALATSANALAGAPAEDASAPAEDKTSGPPSRASLIGSWRGGQNSEDRVRPPFQIY